MDNISQVYLQCKQEKKKNIACDTLISIVLIYKQGYMVLICYSRDDIERNVN